MLTDEQRKLVEDNLDIAYKIAYKWRNPAIEFEDKVQIATMGLCRAAEVYDASKGSFSTIAYPFAKFQLLKAANKKHPYILSLESRIMVNQKGDEMKIKDLLRYDVDYETPIQAHTVSAFINSLHGKTGEAMRLTAAGYKQTEIARAFGVSKQCVNIMIHRARVKAVEAIGAYE